MALIGISDGVAQVQHQTQPPAAGATGSPIALPNYVSLGDQVAQIQQWHQEAGELAEKQTEDNQAAVEGMQKQVDSALDNLRADLPVTPNLLVDTKQFTGLCGGQTNVPMEVITAHSGAPWISSLYINTAYTGTVEVVTLDQLAAKGIPYGGDLGYFTDSTFYGSDFRVALFDVTITADAKKDLQGRLFALNQGCPPYTGWTKAQVTTQFSCVANVIEQSGGTHFIVSSNRGPTLALGGDLAGKGWKFHHTIRKGFGGCDQPIFLGIGHIKVAVALMYFGFGNHDGVPFWAGAAGGIYSHRDRLVTPNRAY